MNPFDEKVVYSFHDQISRGLGFTEKQSHLAVKIVKRHLVKLSTAAGIDVQPFTENPTFRLERRVVTLGKRISVIPHPVYTKALKVEFPYNDSIVEKIRKDRTTFAHAAWDKDERAWIFALTETAINFLMSTFDLDDVSVDDEFRKYVEQTEIIQNNLDFHVPMLTTVDGSLKLVNVLDRVPQPETTDLVNALFFARNVGVSTWDESISERIVSEKVPKVVTDFLDTQPDKGFEVNLEETPFFELKNVVKNLFPTIFIIPGGSELEKTELSVTFLKELGVDPREISVLFRLPSETSEKFNTFVKENGLNSPVTQDTKAVFISGKVPKTIVDSKIKFNSVVNHSIYSVHYTIREFIKHNHNVIHVVEKKAQRNFNFAVL